MTVEELIKKLESMPQNVLVYAEGELADSVVLENCQGNIYVRIFKAWDVEFTGRFEPQESDHKCHTCKHYTSGERDGSCGSYICKNYSNWESEEA